VDLLTERGAEPIRNLAVDFETDILYGRPLTDAEKELGKEQDPDMEVIQPGLPLGFFRKFATVQTIDLDMYDLPTDRLLQMNNVFRHCKMLPSLKRLTLQITGKIYLPMTLVNQVLNDNSINDNVKLKWWEQYLVEVFFFNLGRVRLEVTMKKEQLADKTYRDIVQLLLPQHLTGPHITRQNLIDMSNEFNEEMEEAFHAPLDTFMEGLNGILGVKGKMLTAKCGTNLGQHWFWDLGKEDEYAQDEIQFTPGLDSIQIHD